MIWFLTRDLIFTVQQTEAVNESYSWNKYWLTLKEIKSFSRACYLNLNKNLSFGIALSENEH